MCLKNLCALCVLCGSFGYVLLIDFSDKILSMKIRVIRVLNCGCALRSLRPGMKKINNELLRTPYELMLSEFVSVRISSLFFSCSLPGMGFAVSCAEIRYGKERVIKKTYIFRYGFSKSTCDHHSTPSRRSMN